MPDFCSRRVPFHYTTVLNILERMGVDINNINILAVGEFENYKGEIKEQHPSAGSAIESDTRITLKVGYPSAVDFMPYQFFYGLGGGHARSGQWEEQARESMAPFDSAVIRHNAHARYQTLKFNMGMVNLEYLSRFLDLFSFQNQDDNRPLNESLIWIALLPFFHFWAGNLRLVEKMLGLIFGYEFQINENVRATYDIPEEIQYQLGSKAGRLGRETILGQSFDESDSGYELIIGGISPNEVGDFLPGKPQQRKLESILCISMPNNLDYHIRFEMARREAIIGREKRSGYLGFATRI